MQGLKKLMVAVLALMACGSVFATETVAKDKNICDISYDDTSSQMFQVQKLCVDNKVVAVIYNQDNKALGAASLNKPCQCVIVKEQGEPAYVVGRETK